jgi:hypothetical protein
MILEFFDFFQLGRRSSIEISLKKRNLRYFRVYQSVNVIIPFIYLKLYLL